MQVEALWPLGRGCCSRWCAASAPPRTRWPRARACCWRSTRRSSWPRCALALAPRAPPVVAGAGAALAAAFLGAGLAGEDSLVLQRLMGLLCAPLAAWDAPAEEVRRCAGGMLSRVAWLGCWFLT